MKAVDKQKVRPKKIEVSHCYLAVDSSNQQMYRVCVVAAIATVSEKYEVYYICHSSTFLLSWLLTPRYTLLTMVAMHKLKCTIYWKCPHH